MRVVMKSNQTLKTVECVSWWGKQPKVGMIKNNKKNWKKLLELAAETDEMINVKNKNERKR